MTENSKSGEDQEALLASAHLGERREPRYTVPIGIEVSGIDKNGEPFHERTVSTDVSRWGCGFSVAVELKPNDIVALWVAAPVPGSEKPRQSLFQVVRVTRQAQRWLIGAWKIDDEDVWGAHLARITEAVGDMLESRKATKRNAE